MADSWYTIDGRVLSFKSRPIKFLVETVDGGDYTIILSNGESATFSSGGEKTLMYSGVESHPKFSFSNPLNIKRFETSSTLFVDNANIGWLNIQRLQCDGVSQGDMSGVSLLTSLTYLRLNGNSFTGDMSGVSLLTSLTYLYLNGNSFTGDMSGVSLLTSLTYLYLNGNSFTGDMSGVSLLTSLTTLYLIGNSFTGDMSGVSLLTSLTYLYLIGNSFIGDMSGVSLLTSLTTLYLQGNSFTGDMSGVSLLTSLTYLYLIGNYTINYTSTELSSNFQRWFFRPTTSTNPMSSLEIDQMLADAASTTWAGTKDIYLDGNNGIRTVASNSSVATLQAMGVTLYLNV